MDKYRLLCKMKVYIQILYTLVTPIDRLFKKYFEAILYLPYTAKYNIVITLN